MKKKAFQQIFIDLYSIFTHANHSINCYLIRSSNSGNIFLRALQVTRGVNSSRSIVVISLGCVGKTTLKRYFTVYSAHLHMPIWFIHLLRYGHVSYFRSIQRNMISNFVQFRLPILCCFTLFRKFVLNFSSPIHTPFVLLWSTVFRTEINKWDYKFARCTQYYTHSKREYLRNGELWLRLFLASFSISFCLNGSRFCSHPKWIIESNQDWDYFQCRLLMIFLSQGAIYEHTASIPTFQPSFCNICLR